MIEETLRTGAEEQVDPDAPGDAHLFVVLEADGPLAPPTRHALAGVDRVVIGRGETRQWERRSAGSQRVLDLRIADARMSATHAELTRGEDGWTLTDRDSRNGTRVNGVARSSALLGDGDRFELGHTHLRLRTGLHDATDSSDAGPVAPGEAGVGFETILPPLARDLDVVRKLARSQVPLVIEAESGCGKELMARSIHALSGRGGPLVAVNCGAIAANLLESELFGYRKGAFSGAAEDRTGLVRSADKGTLLLDEIADLSPSAQTALLRVLQEREVVPVGASKPVPVDVRFLAACQRPLRERVAAGALRADLLARLAGFTVRIPPLRDRLEDLGLVLAALLRRLAPHTAERFTFTSAAAEALLAYDWPFNVRELERALETAIVLAGDSHRIAAEHLPEPIRAATLPRARPAEGASSLPPAPDAATSLAGVVRLSRREDVRRRELEALLAEHEGNVSAVARVTGKARAQIHRWLRRYGIDAQQYVR
jgi:DNA-binding NtrC family response regulator